jgi:hypothetical protein
MWHGQVLHDVKFQSIQQILHNIIDWITDNKFLRLNLSSTWTSSFKPHRSVSAWVTKTCHIETAVISVLLVLARAAIPYCIINDLYKTILSLNLFLACDVGYKFESKDWVENDICEQLSTEQHWLACSLAASAWWIESIRRANLDERSFFVALLLLSWRRLAFRSWYSFTKEASWAVLSLEEMHPLWLDSTRIF